MYTSTRVSKAVKNFESGTVIATIKRAFLGKWRWDVPAASAPSLARTIPPPTWTDKFFLVSHQPVLPHRRHILASDWVNKKLAELEQRLK
jgi:hypothetical protein